MFAFLLLGITLYWVLYEIYWRFFVNPTFEGKVVYVTGASSGIGEELAKRFVLLKAKKVIISARRREELERVKSEC
jgi:dehydrogenase/reductase SDR family protein 7